MVHHFVVLTTPTTCVRTCVCVCARVRVSAYCVYTCVCARVCVRPCLYNYVIACVRVYNPSQRDDHGTAGVKKGSLEEKLRRNFLDFSRFLHLIGRRRPHFPVGSLAATQRRFSRWRFTGRNAKMPNRRRTPLITSARLSPP